MSASTESDLERARRAVERGALTQEQLDGCLAERRRLLKDGLEVGLRDLLLERGLLDRARWDGLDEVTAAPAAVPADVAATVAAAEGRASKRRPRIDDEALPTGVGHGGQSRAGKPSTGTQDDARVSHRRERAEGDHRKTVSDHDLPTTGDGQGEMLGGYRILSELGRGAMGIVYEAVQERLGRRVALKVLPQTQALQGIARERFMREAQATASLKHPGIVPIYDTGEERGVHYFAMELIVGRSLKRILDEDGKLAPQRAAEIARAAAEALHVAHEHGVIHRDVKPDNIIVRADGQPVLTDFGLAVRERDVALTRDGTIVGTPLYMSPEQARGDGAPIDRRADVYGLGVTLYELLAGAVPFEDAKDTGALLEKVTTEEPPPLAKVAPDVPLPLRAIVEVAIEKDPARRFQTAQAMADDLGRYLQGEPILALPPTRMTRAWRQVRRRRRGIAAAILLAALGIIVAAGVRFLALRWKADGLVLEAIRLVRAGQPGEALQALDQALELWPELAEAHFRKGEIDLARGDRDAARAAFSEALAHDAAHVEALLARGVLAREEGTLEAALGDLRAARRRATPGDPRPALHEGLTLLALDRAPVDARLALREGLELARAARLTRDPLYGEAVLRLAETELRLGDAAAALPELEEAVRLMPDEVGPQLLLATALIERGNDAAAVEALSAALRRDPAHARALELRGRCQRRLGQSVAAFRDLSAAAAELPGARLTRGLLRFETLDFLGTPDEIAFDDAGARQDLDAVKDEPRLAPAEQAEAHLAVGWLELLATRSYRTRALESFERAIALAPAAPGPRLARALTLVETNRLDEAEAELALATPLPGTGYAVKILAARVAEGRGDLTRARALLDEAVALEPARTTAWGYRYRLRLRTGDAEAQDDLKRATARQADPRPVPFSAQKDPFQQAEQSAQLGLASFVEAVRDATDVPSWRHHLTRSGALLDRALAFDPWNLPAAARRASVQYLLGHYEPAARAYERARVVDPALVEADVNRAVLQRDLLEDQGPRQAEATLRRAALEPRLDAITRGALCYELARTLVMLGRHDEALEQLEEASRLSPRRHAVASLRARLIGRLGRPGLAEALDRATLLFAEGERDRLRGRLYARAGRRLEDADRFDEAEHFLTRAIEADPQNPEPWRIRASVRFRGDPKEIPSAFVDTFVSAELDASFANRFLEVESRLHRFRPFLGQLEERVDEVAHEQPDVPAAAFFKGYVVFHQGRHAEAEAWFHQAYLRSREKSFTSIAYRGACRLRAGQLDEAQQDLDRSFALAPDNPVAGFWTACLVARRGDAQGAIKRIEELAARGFPFVEQIKAAPELEVLREDPRIKKLMGARN